MTGRPVSRGHVATLLSTVVLTGKVLGMTAFVLFDLAGTGGIIRMGALVAAAFAVGMAFISGRHPLIAVYATAVASAGMSALTVLIGFAGSARLFGLAEVAALAIASSDLAHRETPTRAVPGIAAAAIASAMVAFRLGDGSATIVLLLVLAVAVTMGILLRWADRNREMTEDMTRSEERMAIARELHDGVAHHVSAIVVQAQAALAAAGDDPAPLRAALENIERSGAATMTSMRRLVDALRGDGAPLTPMAGVEDLRDLLDEAAGSGMPLEVEIDETVITPAIAPSVYRIVQEAITNVRRHARGIEKVSVEVKAIDGGAQVTVADDGDPVERAGDDGHGITGMSERVAALGGHFWAGPRPGRGWSVRAWIPLEKRR